MASVLDNRPSCIDDVLDRLYDERDITTIDLILKAFEEMKGKMTRNALSKLLQKIRVNWWNQYPLPYTLSRLLVKSGKESEPLLLEMIRQSEKYDFALDCLKKIGVSREKITTVFSQPPLNSAIQLFLQESA